MTDEELEFLVNQSIKSQRIMKESNITWMKKQARQDELTLKMVEEYKALKANEQES